MANIIPVPTMSTQGFVTDLAGKLDYLLAHFFLSDYNQTQLYPGGVLSFHELVQRCGGDAEQLMELIQRGVSSYLGNYYDSVQVDVTPAIPLDQDPSVRVEIIMSIALRDANGGVGAYTRKLIAQDSKLSQIVKLSNG